MVKPLMVIAGAGLIGGELARLAAGSGWRVRILRRGGDVSADPFIDDDGYEAAFWDPAEGSLRRSHLAGARAVVCLSGAPIAPKPWTKSRKVELIQSRLDSVTTITRVCRRLLPGERPEVLLTGSAIGYYGDCGDVVLDDQPRPRGAGFLAGLCEHWEDAAKPAEAVGIRVVHNRTGLVVSKKGGIGRMLHDLYRRSLGAQLGDGTQWQSFISLTDAGRALLFAIENEDVRGTFNMTCPTPVRNFDLHAYLDEFYAAPSPWRAPATVLNMLGRMGNELLLFSQRVVPSKLESKGFEFCHHDLRAIWEAEFSRN